MKGLRRKTQSLDPSNEEEEEPQQQRQRQRQQQRRHERCSYDSRMMNHRQTPTPHLLLTILACLLFILSADAFSTMQTSSRITVNHHQHQTRSSILTIRRQQSQSSTDNSNKNNHQASDSRAVLPNQDVQEQLALETTVASNKRTLYDLLGARPTDSRTELKEKYVALARLCHPDAMRSKGNAKRGTNANDDDDISIPSNENIADFAEIAAAWRTLSNAKQRKRYDRSLAAEEFSKNVQNWAGDFVQTAAPVAAAFGKAAAPLWRRTAVTTLASVQAAAQQVRQQQSQAKSQQSRSRDSYDTAATSSEDFTNITAATDEAWMATEYALNQAAGTITTTTNPNTNANRNTRSSAASALPSETEEANVAAAAFTAALQAAKKAGRYVDGLEYLEQAASLEQRAQQQQWQLQELRQALIQTAEQRLRLALATPGSGLTSTQAQAVLGNLTDLITPPQQEQQEGEASTAGSSTVWNRGVQMLQWRAVRVSDEIHKLQQAESVFVAAQGADTAAQEEYQQAVERQLRSLQAMSAAERREVEARQAWEDAKVAVKETKRAAEDASRLLTQAKVESKKSDYDMERQSIALALQSEKVRGALRQKEEAVRKTLQHEVTANTDMTSLFASELPLEELESAERYQQLSELRSKERQLRLEVTQLEAQNLQIRKRAESFKDRAAALGTDVDSMMQNMNSNDNKNVSP